MLKNYLAKGIAAAGLTFTAVTIIYAGQPAAMGPLEIPNSALKLLPILVGFLYPLIAAKWPAIAAVFKTIAAYFQSSDGQDLLKKITDLQAIAAKQGEVEVFAKLQELSALLVQKGKNA